MIENINWYPGHMKKTRELIQENLKLIDVVVEVVDARIPKSSRNPIIDELVRGKTRVIAFNKNDLANGAATECWLARYREAGIFAVPVNSMSGAGVSNLFHLLTKLEDELNRERTRKKPLRMMIVGVPNVGKSSLINRMTGHKSAKTGDRPGVTKGKQWLSLENGMQLLDTPGILWPKFEDPKVGLNLAFCGAIKDEILDSADLALELIRVLGEDCPDLLVARYRIDGLGETPLETMEAIAQKRGFILPGKKIDYERTARTVLDEFRGAVIGRITLERPEAQA